MGGRKAQEGGDICILIADSHCRTKPTQHCKAIILQLKKIKLIVKKRVSTEKAIGTQSD